MKTSAQTCLASAAASAQQASQPADLQQAQVRLRVRVRLCLLLPRALLVLQQEAAAAAAFRAARSFGLCAFCLFLFPSSTKLSHRPHTSLDKRGHEPLDTVLFNVCLFNVIQCLVVPVPFALRAFLRALLVALLAAFHSAVVSPRAAQAQGRGGA